MTDADVPDLPAMAEYSGRLRLSWPEDLYILGSRQALVGLRRAIDRALSRGIGACLGPDSDLSDSRCYVIVVDPLPDNLAPELRGRPTEVPERAGIVVPFHHKGEGAG